MKLTRYAGSLAQHYFATGEIGEIAQVYSKARGKNEERLVNPSTGNLFGLKAGSKAWSAYLHTWLRLWAYRHLSTGLAAKKTKAEIDAMRKAAGYGPLVKSKAVQSCSTRHPNCLVHST